MKYKTYSLDRDMSGEQVRKEYFLKITFHFNENLQSSLKQTGVQGVSNKSVQLHFLDTERKNFLNHLLFQPRACAQTNNV